MPKPKTLAIAALVAMLSLGLTVKAESLVHQKRVKADHARVAEVIKAGSEMPFCEEDMSCWDCRTMGNRICEGPPQRPLNPIGEECRPGVKSVCGPGYLVTSEGRALMVHSNGCIFVTYEELDRAGYGDPGDGAYFCER